MTRDVSASQVLDRLERLEDAVESLQQHVKWLLERAVEPDVLLLDRLDRLERHIGMIEPEGLTLKELADRLDGRLDDHIGMIDAHKRG